MLTVLPPELMAWMSGARATGQGSLLAKRLDGFALQGSWQLRNTLYETTLLVAMFGR
jgi:hypothetical protein